MNRFVCFLLLVVSSVHAQTVLKDNIVKAEPGNYIVTAQGKNFTVMHIQGKFSNHIVIEEISVPSHRMPKGYPNWRAWVAENAPGHTCWMIYNLDTHKGSMNEAYSFTKNSWYTIPEADNFLSTLLNLSFEMIPEKQRRRTGSALGSGESPKLWQPKMIFNGQAVDGVEFDVWRTRWPNDGSELAGKNIEAFIPKNESGFPTYFPYWLEVSGMIGKAKIRVIDSGSGMTSPKKMFPIS